MPRCPGGDVFREEDDRLLADGKPLLHQQLHCHSGEGASWMEINKVPLYDEHGDPIALFAMVSAIDQRKELEQTFRQQQLLQRRLLDAIPDLIRLEDHQGVLIDCNQAFLDFMGLVASEALGRRVPPRLPVEQTLGQGSIAWWMPRAEAAIWRSPGSRCRMTRATPSAS